MPDFLQTLVDILLLLGYALYTYVEALYRLFVPIQPKSLAGEVILITGSAGGIGKRICAQLASSGATLVCWDYVKKENDQLVKELKQQGARAFSYQVDITDIDQVKTVAAQVRRDAGDVSILINNAGVCDFFQTVEQPREIIERMFKVNVLSNFWTIQEFLPKMIENRRGHLVATSSMAGLVGIPGLTAYSSSKFAVTGYMDALKKEMAVHPSKPDIKFTTIHPVIVNTPMYYDMVELQPSRYSRLNKVIEPEYVAKLIVDGIKQNKTRVCCPPSASGLRLAECLVPDKLLMKLFQIYDQNNKVTLKNK